MAPESYTIEAMVRGYHVYKKVWCAAVERCELSRSVCCSSDEIWSSRRLRPKKNIVGVYDVLETRLNNQLQ